MAVWKALVMMFGFWVVLAGGFFVSDSLMQRLKIKPARQEKVQAALFLALFFFWWGFFYLWFVH
ncbi:MAG: hypothetical protein JW938_06165 [Candidatus Omnitrophica bacterium]|nr:hypothetical protein [Candidatus Omnitrophota bacterium]